MATLLIRPSELSLWRELFRQMVAELSAVSDSPLQPSVRARVLEVPPEDLEAGMAALVALVRAVAQRVERLMVPTPIPSLLVVAVVRGTCSTAVTVAVRSN
jgi:hypothetical protein